MDQDELIKELSLKSNKSFNTLYDMYSKSLFAIVSNIVKDTYEAEDALQETFVKIWKNFHTYDSSKGRLYTWMLNIARNTAIDKMKSKSHSISEKNYELENFVYLASDNSNVTQKMDSIGIKEFINKLKPKCIQVIEFLFFQGYTHQEASEHLKIPLGTIKTLNRNCINELRSYLAV